MKSPFRNMFHAIGSNSSITIIELSDWRTMKEVHMDSKGRMIHIVYRGADEIITLKHLFPDLPIEGLAVKA